MWSHSVFRFVPVNTPQHRAPIFQSTEYWAKKEKFTAVRPSRLPILNCFFTFYIHHCCSLSAKSRIISVQLVTLVEFLFNIFIHKLRSKIKCGEQFENTFCFSFHNVVGRRTINTVSSVIGDLFSIASDTTGVYLTVKVSVRRVRLTCRQIERKRFAISR